MSEKTGTRLNVTNQEVCIICMGRDFQLMITDANTFYSLVLTNPNVLMNSISKAEIGSLVWFLFQVEISIGVTIVLHANLSTSKFTKHHSMPIYARIRQRNVTTRISQIFGKLSANFRQTIGDSYLNKYMTISSHTFAQTP